MSFNSDSRRAIEVNHRTKFYEPWGINCFLRPIFDNKTKTSHILIGLLLSVDGLTTDCDKGEINMCL